ncbi:MAG: hypothetical protein A2745_00880 [Candidatus Harrisonbacteria bacterium RIFCSPHIGHO2_01_FULL_44_13]|uniref:Clp R domain-containing protein n=1 Tax=Candidatus Harrisonbacteria bacterium RIFCSPLOWO2_01_FULL_44_18 TaxID=1798407 RepID=A0A1G1ZMA6_9BACT|nr:MAG: hypothetical protein A2745_00880 [Candidatus Harrisonbacteria bacterium RIFCSPHIGHO2_01_FULL_44_13]OGY65681.1 MAG: hypothetical protein A3A16_03635 [Candidatus Harrisonbacteria bacterium RIFCSPLOWO2_01_FULL_44_18]
MNQKLEFYFDEPRLRMGFLGRFLARLISFTAYGVAAAAALVFSLSDIRWLNGLGWLLILFLGDRLSHIGQADRSLYKLPRRGRINIANYLLPTTLGVLEYARGRAGALGGDLALFILQRLIDQKDIQTALIRMDVKPEEIEQKVDDYLGLSSKDKLSKEVLDQQIEALSAGAFHQAIVSGNAYIEPKDLFSALQQLKSENIAKVFKLFNIGESDLENVLIFSRFRRRFSLLRRLPSSLAGVAHRPFKFRQRIMNRAWTARPTPFLDRFSEDFTALARLEKVGFLIGHEQEYDRLTDVLSRPGNPNVLLVGDPGAGKGTLAAHLAFRIAKDRVPPPLFDKRLVSLEIGSLVAGANEGELQERVKKIIEEIVSAGNIILYIPDIHNLVKTSGQMRLSAADVLMPAIKGDAFSVIGATYPREFKQYIEPNNDFVSAFEVVRVQEISEDEAIKFLVYDSIILEDQYRMIISFSAIKQSAMLAHKYFRQKLLPTSAEDLLKEALADASEKRKKILSGDDVIEIAQRKINIPLRAVKETEAKKLLDLEELIHRRLIDQEEAVRAVARAMREYRSGLSRKGGPISTFLFVGPTGVGKTELSKILTKIQFGATEAMIRFDMSEYQNKESIYRFIGSPDGTAGGTLTNAVLEKPYGLVLLDEFEKAHPDILNLFLQVFDDGRLTDSLGRTADFQNTIIIATSNAHSDFIKAEIEKGRNMKDIGDELKKKLTSIFRPELLNRFSGVIVFRNLLPEHIAAIAKIQLEELAATLRDQGVELAFDDPAIKKVAELGYDPVFGARPLRNVISDRIKSVLAEKILKNEISRGSKLTVGFKNEEFQFKIL